MPDPNTHQPASPAPALAGMGLAPATVLDTPAAAARLGVSPATLATWRCTGEVRIPFARIGRRVVYRAQDLDDFLAARVAAASMIQRSPNA